MPGNTSILRTAVLLMAASLALSAAAVLLTFDRLHRDVVVERYYLAATHLHRNLQHAARYGLNFRDAKGLNRDLNNTLARLRKTAVTTTRGNDGVNLAKSVSVIVATPDGEILTGVGDPAGTVHGSRRLGPILATPNAPGESAAGKRFVIDAGRYWLPQKISDPDNEWVASLVVSFDAELIEPQAARLLVDAGRRVGVALLIAVVVYGLLVNLRWNGRSRLDNAYRWLLWRSAAFGLVSQLLMGGLAAALYTADYRHESVETVQALLRIAKEDVQPALARGSRIQDLDFARFEWQALARQVEELGALEVTDDNGRIVARLDEANLWQLQDHQDDLTDTLANALPSFTNERVAAKVLTVRGATAGFVTVRTSAQGVRGRMLDVLADGLTTIIVCLLIFFESMLAVCACAEHRERRAETTSDQHFAMVRPAMFLFLFGLDLSMSFVPLYTETLFEPVLGLSKSVIVGLPISVEFLFVGLSILASGTWIDRSGWRPPLRIGVFVAGVGMLYGWLAPNVIHFILSRAVMGIGFGLTLMSFQSYVISKSDARSKARGLAQLFAGLYGGSICGAAVGAILAERLGFAPVFALGALIVFLVLIYIWRILPADDTVADNAIPVAPKQAPANVADPGTSTPAKLSRFLSSRDVLSLTLLSSLPASIVAVGFLNYFGPIYLYRMGASQSTIGQILILYGFCLVFLGPWVSRSIDTIRRKKLAVFAGCMVGATAFLCFNLFDGVVAASVAVLMLGVSHSLILSAQAAYTLALKVTRDLGEAKAMSIFRSSGRLGQMAGPLAFGWILVGADLEQGLVHIGYAYVFVAFLFLVLTRTDRRVLVEGEA